jgi:hypothetical protein
MQDVQDTAVEENGNHDGDSSDGADVRSQSQSSPGRSRLVQPLANALGTREQHSICMSTDKRRIRTSIPEEHGKEALPLLLARIHELEMQAEQQQHMKLQDQQVIRDLTDDNQRLRELLSKAFVSLEKEPGWEDAGRLKKKLLEALDSKESIEAVAEEGAAMLERALLRLEKENGRRKAAEDRALRLSHEVEALQSDLRSLQLTVEYIESLTEVSKRGGGHEESEETRREVYELQVCVCVCVFDCVCVCWSSYSIPRCNYSTMETASPRV